MAIHKVIQVSSTGVQSEYAGKSASAGVGDAGEFVIFGADGKIDITNLPNGIGPDAITANAGENLSAGDMVYISGAGTIFKADATLPAKAARGFTLAAVSTGSPATIYFDESNSGVTGLTPGVTYYLSATAGLVTTTPPTTTGQIVQEVGFAVSATNLHVNIQETITRA